MGLRRALLAMAAAGALALAACGADAEAAEPVDLDFQVPTVDGGTFEGAGLAGKPAVLWFWAPWCVTCAGQAPHVNALVAEYGDRVNVVGVAGLDDSVEAMQRFVDLTEIHDFPQLADRDGVVWRRFEISTQSSFAVIDDRGVVVASGSLDPTGLPDRLDALLG